MKFGINSSLMEGAFTILQMGKNNYFPYDYTGAKNELLGCRESAWIGIFLNISPVYDVYGPDVVKLLNYVCVNTDFGKVRNDAARHAIMCNEKGQMLADGVLVKIAENHFRTYWLAPVLAYYVERLGMNVEGKWVRDDEYFFQIDGPKSLEILEKACQCDLHDIRFAHHRMAKINGMDMRVLRLGMSGALAYEVHGPAEDADEVYRLIREAGKEFGIRPLGYRHYCANHTQGGYPNQYIHFFYPYLTSGEYLAGYCADYFNASWGIKDMNQIWKGSCADDMENYFVTPYEVSWGYLVNFNHDFIGKDALEKISRNPPCTCVTLEWNADDIADVFASQFRGSVVEPYEIIDRIRDFGDSENAPYQLRMNKVFLNDERIGKEGGRSYDYYHRRMISLAFIEQKYAAVGTDVVILWGTPATPQKEIRAKIATFPYYNEEYRNETFDTERIPHPAFGK